MNNTLLTKKDIVALNQSIGEKGLFNNGSSLGFALNISKTKRNWLYELSYIVRSLLVDHAFVDGNKRTCSLVVIYYFEEKSISFDRNRLMHAIRRIAKNSIANPIKIMRLLYHVKREKN